MRRRLIGCVLLGAIVTGLVTADASSPRFWKFTTLADFARGEADSLSIDANGRLVLGPRVTLTHEATEPFLWALAVAPDGTLYAGSGNEGRVFRIDAGGRATAWFDADELEVHALAIGPDGSVFVATSPEGKVYKVAPDGSAVVFFDPDDKYIWSLVFDGRGRLLVGTGEKGVIYRVDGEGRSEVLTRTQAKHVTSMALDTSGRVLAATDSPGRVLRVDDAGRGFVVLDTPYRELRGLAVGKDGAVYAAGVNGKAAETGAGPAAMPEPARAAPTPAVSTEITAITVLDAPTIVGAPAPAQAPSEAGTPKGTVYRIAPDGSWEAIWESTTDLPFDLQLDDGGAVIVATGDGGRIYRLAGSPWQATLVTQLPVKQVTAMARSGARRVLATSNPAKIFTMLTEPASEGTYISEVKDAGMTAAWGSVTWRAEPGAGSVQVFTRSGNTPTPGDMWSEWAGPYAAAEGEASKSPAARYFQWKTVLRAGAGTGTQPVLTSLAVSYLQQNVRPRVTSITVHPPGVVFQKPYPTGEPEIAGLGDVPSESRVPVFSMPLGTVQPGPSAGPAFSRRLYQKGLQAFFWRAEDGNDDRLEYSAFYRRADGTTWYPLRAGMTEAILVWDTSSVPDGAYVLKIAASDHSANAPGTGLVGELDSAAFDVDNSAPTVTVGRVAREAEAIVVQFDVRDSFSSIDRVEYSVDAGPWVTVYPADGMADTKVERYTVKVPANGAGGLVVRAADVMNNVATARVAVPDRAP